MCCARVCRCRAACCAQGGAGKAHRPDHRRRRARRDFPRSAKAAFLTFPSGAESSDRGAREGTRVNPRISSWTNIGPTSVEHVHPFSSQLWTPVCRSAGDVASAARAACSPR